MIEIVQISRDRVETIRLRPVQLVEGEHSTRHGRYHGIILGVKRER